MDEKRAAFLESKIMKFRFERESTSLACFGSFFPSQFIPSQTISPNDSSFSSFRCQGMLILHVIGRHIVS